VGSGASQVFLPILFASRQSLNLHPRGGEEAKESKGLFNWIPAPAKPAPGNPIRGWNDESLKDE